MRMMLAISVLLVFAAAPIANATNLVADAPKPVPFGGDQFECPDGWDAVFPPVNPALRCLPGNVAPNWPADPTAALPPPFGCPEDGWKRPDPAINPVIQCVPDGFRAGAPTPR